MSKKLELTPLSPHVGVEVHGLDLSREMGREEAELLRHAFARHHLLLVRQPGVTDEQQAAFARHFGAIEIRNKSAGSDGVTQHVSNARADGILGDGEINFHHDHLFYPHPLSALILYGIEIPRSGSVTKFRSGEALYNSLSASMKERISGVECLHLYNYAADYTKRQDISKAPADAPRAWQSLVWTHPVTQAKALWLSPLNIVAYRGIGEKEGEELIDEIVQLAEASDEFVYAHAWAPGDLVMWSNVMLQHARMPFNHAEKRTLRRTPIVQKEMYE